MENILYVEMYIHVYNINKVLNLLCNEILFIIIN